ncbi:MAG: class I SAM-dependent methyltransferase [Betaproteobacteria bacterium]|nr:class I SAM-dependent methyltransferase [Betaproteobacteria bacterium]
MLKFNLFSSFNWIASIRHLPATRAFAAQGFALLSVGILWQIWEYLIPSPSFTLGMAVLAQGLLAALFSRWFKLAVWWWLIQFLLPLALLVTFTLHLPAFLFLSGFLLLLVLYGHTFRTQVPYYPSNRATWDAIVQFLPADRSFKLIDTGSGTGGLVLNLAARYPNSEIIGVELAPLLWLFSKLRARFTRSRAQFIRADYHHFDFSQFDIVFAYLSPAAMPTLWQKAHREMRPGTILLSNEFFISEKAADAIIQTEGMRVPLYAWHM